MSIEHVAVIGSLMVGTVLLMILVALIKSPKPIKTPKSELGLYSHKTRNDVVEVIAFEDKGLTVKVETHVGPGYMGRKHLKKYYTKL